MFPDLSCSKSHARASWDLGSVSNTAAPDSSKSVPPKVDSQPNQSNQLPPPSIRPFFLVARTLSNMFVSASWVQVPASNRAAGSVLTPALARRSLLNQNTVGLQSTGSPNSPGPPPAGLHHWYSPS